MLKCAACTKGQFGIDSMGYLGTSLVMGVCCCNCGQPATLWISPRTFVGSLTYLDLDGNVDRVDWFDLKPVDQGDDGPLEFLPF